MCPAGYYCPQGTQRFDQFPCPKGTYSNQTGLQDVSQCIFAPGGMYVDVVAAKKPVGNCSVGYYCLKGATSATPDENVDMFAGSCSFGSFCPQGTSLPTPCMGRHSDHLSNY